MTRTRNSDQKEVDNSSAKLIGDRSSLVQMDTTWESLKNQKETLAIQIRKSMGLSEKSLTDLKELTLASSQSER